MIAYISTFLTSYLLFKAADRFKEKIVKILLCVIALLLPSILAGLRDYSIGTDVLIYGNTWFERAVAYTDDFSTFIKWATGSGIGFMYALLNYAVAKFTEDPHIFYFILNLLANLLAFSAAKSNKDLVDIPFAMLVYYCIFYNLTLNLLRQSLAMMLILWGFKYIRNRKIFQYLIVVVIATLFHSTAVIGVILYFMYVIGNGKFKTVSRILMVIGCLLVVCFYADILNIFLGRNYIADRYSFYLTDSGSGGGFVRIFLLCLPVLISMLLFLRKEIVRNNEWNGLVVYVIFSLLLSCLAFRVSSIVRIAYYFDIMMVIAIPMTVNNLKLKNVSNNKKYIKLMVGCYLIFYWCYVFGIRNSGQTVPYIMMSFT